MSGFIIIFVISFLIGFIFLSGYRKSKKREK